MSEKFDCAVRDIKDYRDGLFDKRTLCRYLVNDLDINCQTWGGTWITTLSGMVIGTLIAKLIGF